MLLVDAQHRVCVSLQAYAKLRTDTPELLDLVAQFAGQDLTDDPMVVDGESTAPIANSGMSMIQVAQICSVLCSALPLQSLTAW